MKQEQRQFTIRLRIVFAMIVFTGFVLIANLFNLQISHGESFRQQADGQYVVSADNAFERGSIYFEQLDGTRINAAGQKSGYKVSINPSALSTNTDELFTKLSSIIDIDKERFYSAIEKKERTYVEIANEISREDGEAIKKEVGKNVQLYTEKWRVYPMGGTAAHVLGFLAYQGDELAGRYGLERTYEDTLKRENIDLYTNFFARIFHNVKKLVDPNKVPEGNIISTIDPQIQLFFESELRDVKETWNSDSVGGIILNPKNGEVYALGALPTFDNNNFRNESPSTFKNPLVQSVYEMGSIMKPLVVAMAIDSGSVDPQTFSYFDAGSVRVEDYTIKNFDGKGRGWVGVQEILTQSLNTGMVAIGKKVPKDTYRKYFENYGFTTETGIDLPGEVSGLTTNLKSNRDIEFANISFGQGIAVTPISMVNALSILANKGKRVTPHVVKKIEYTSGFSKSLDYADSATQVISPETATEVSKMLVNVFDAYNNGRSKIPHYSIAAKTGTAQIPAPQGGYYSDRNLHSFFGYFPAYDPQFIIFLYTVYPKGVKYSSQTLIEPFQNTTKYLINYYNIPPDR